MICAMYLTHSAADGEQATNVSHQKAMAHIRQATWPLVLRFRLPLEERDVFSLAKIADMRYDYATKCTHA